MLSTRISCVVLAGLISSTQVRAQERAAAEPAAATKMAAARDDYAAEQLGWRLAVQAWTFRDRTAFEAIDTAHRLGLRYIELYPGQKLSPEHGEAKVGVGMTPELLVALAEKLQSSQVHVVNFGVVGLNKDEHAARALFGFAKSLAIETITCEPDDDAWDLGEKLADEYGINLACHDHPKPSHYWNPDTVLAAVQHRSPRLGACADTGHWPRSGLEPIACLQKLRGRIKTLHFKDIAPLDKTGIDRPWGTGAENARGMLEELHAQGFRGAISIEYETGAGKELEDNVARCIAFFDGVARELRAADLKKGS
ncbi:MAG: sugar phosphate isomerase/epimerase [Planctomycetota bacterium]